MIYVIKFKGEEIKTGRRLGNMKTSLRNHAEKQCSLPLYRYGINLREYLKKMNRVLDYYTIVEIDLESIILYEMVFQLDLNNKFTEIIGSYLLGAEE